MSERTAPLSNSTFRRLCRMWGWTESSDGDTYMLRKGGYNGLIFVGAAGSAHPDMEDIEKILKHEKLAMTAFMKGPVHVKRERPQDVPQEDLTWWVNTIEGSDEWNQERWEEISSRLLNLGLLKQYAVVRSHAQHDIKTGGRTTTHSLTVPIHREEHELTQDTSPTTRTKIVPLPVNPDDEGYFTLSDILSLVNLKVSELSRTACEILCALSVYGDMHDASGTATRRLFEKMPTATTANPVGLGYISMTIKRFEEVGVIWREKNEKRTFKIGLSVQIKLTDDELDKFTLHVQQEEIAASLAEPVSNLVETFPPFVPEVEPQPMETFPPPLLGARNMTPAVEAIQKEIDFAQSRIDHYQERIDTLRDAVKILESL